MKGRNCRKLCILGAGFIFPATDSHGLPGWEQHLLGSESPNSASNPQNQSSQEPWDPGYQHHPPCLFSDSNCAKNSIHLLTALMGIRGVQIIAPPLLWHRLQRRSRIRLAQHVPGPPVPSSSQAGTLSHSCPPRTSPANAHPAAFALVTSWKSVSSLSSRAPATGSSSHRGL